MRLAGSVEALTSMSRMYANVFTPCGPQLAQMLIRTAAVEVETGDSDISHNIEADLKAGFTCVLSVPTNPCAEKETQYLIIREDCGDKVRDLLRALPGHNVHAVAVSGPLLGFRLGPEVFVVLDDLVPEVLVFEPAGPKAGLIYAASLARFVYFTRRSRRSLTRPSPAVSPRRSPSSPARPAKAPINSCHSHRTAASYCARI